MAPNSYVDTKFSQAAFNLVWNVGTLRWVAMQQPILEAGSITINLPNEGQQTLTNSISVAIASDQTTLPTKELRSATATTSQVADTASSTTLLAANANRLGAMIVNDSSAALYVKLGTTASTTDYSIRITQHAAPFIVPANYTGRIDGIWASDPNDGAARITELT